MLYENRTFADETVYLSGNVFRNCHFVRCELVFDGEACELPGSTFEDYKVTLTGKATQTIWFLWFLYNSGAEETVEKFFEIIKQSPDKPKAPDWPEFIRG